MPGGIGGSLNGMTASGRAVEPVSYAMREWPTRGYYYDWRPTIYLSWGWRFEQLSAGDEIMLEFIAGILRSRLNDRLRFGETKAVYGISVLTSRYGPVSSFSVRGSIDPEDIEEARAIITEELAMLRDGTLPGRVFLAERDALAEQLLVSVVTPQQLGARAYGSYFDRSKYQDYPDLHAQYSGIELSDVSAFIRSRFDDELTWRNETRPIPIPETVAALLAAVGLIGLIALRRRFATRPIDMTRIRYVARIRMPYAYMLIVGTLFVVLVAAIVRVLMYLYERLSYFAFVPIDSFFIQYLVYAVMAASIVLFVLWALGRIPSKVLVFDDRVLIKYRSYRSVEIPLAELDDTGLVKLPEIWRSGGLWRCIPFKLGLISAGLLLRRKRGLSYYFDVRDRRELLRVLDSLRAAS